MIDVCKAHNLPEPAYKIWAEGTIVLTFQRPKTAIHEEKPPKMAEKFRSLQSPSNLFMMLTFEEFDRLVKERDMVSEFSPYEFRIEKE